MYQYTTAGSIKRLADSALIPIDSLNTDYQAVLEWVAAGNAIQPEVVEPTIPQSVTMRQVRLALLQSGLLSTVSTAIAEIPGTAGEVARIEWEFSSMVERNNQLVQSMATALGLTNAQLDTLFTLAATL